MYTSLVQSLKGKFRIALALFAPFLLAIGVAAIPMQAKAGGLTLANCTGSHTATWTMGATNKPQLITVGTNSQWGACVQLLPYPALGSASSVDQFTATFDCSSILSPVGATWTINWADGMAPSTSTYTFSAQVNAADGNLVITTPGSITAGRYAGASALGTFVLDNVGATLNDLCNTPGGITSGSGLSTLVITQL
jgi:hypothetical protein